MEITVRSFSAGAIQPYIADAARLRISVFKEFPYLYEGHASYEEEYLADYSKCARSVMAVAFREGAVVGVSTGLPMLDADESFQTPFLSAGYDLGDWFYFGESVLDLTCRGQGVGHRFFDEREVFARSHGFRFTTFCSVIRQPGHPQQPAGYHPHDVFWTKRGYRKQPGLVAHLSWPQIGSGADEVQNQLVFWTRELP